MFTSLVINKRFFCVYRIVGFFSAEIMDGRNGIVNLDLIEDPYFTDRLTRLTDQFRQQSENKAIRVAFVGAVMLILGSAMKESCYRVVMGAGRGSKVAGLILLLGGLTKYNIC